MIDEDRDLIRTAFLGLDHRELETTGHEGMSGSTARLREPALAAWKIATQHRKTRGA